MRFTAVVMEKGDLWSFGKGAYGQLGLGTDADQLLPACVGGAEKVFGGEAVVMVAAGEQGLVRTKTFFGVVSIRRST